MKKIGVLVWDGEHVSRSAGGAHQLDGARRHSRGVCAGGRREGGRAQRLRGHRRSHLARHAVLSRVPEECGADRDAVINNPFWWSADDKFFNYSLAKKLGVAVPRTVLLPHKQFPPEINEQLDAQPRVSAGLGWHLRLRQLPAFLKPHRWRRMARRPSRAQPG